MSVALDPLDFLTALYEHVQPAWLSLFTIDRNIGGNRVHWYRTDQLADIVAELPAMHDRCVWFGVATRRERLDDGLRGGAADCLQVPALWLDIDVAGPNHRTRNPLPPDSAAAYQLLDDHPVAANLLVDTGGGLQAWWLLDEPLDAADAQPVLDQWRDTWQTRAGRRGWHIDNVFDVPRIMRLPGSRNTKGISR